MSENADGFIDGLLNEIADRVIKKISENNSNWLNNIQYKVKAENIEGLIKVKQIEYFESAVNACLDIDSVRNDLREMATEAAEEALKEATFEVSVS